MQLHQVRTGQGLGAERAADARHQGQIWGICELAAWSRRSGKSQGDTLEFCPALPVNSFEQIFAQGSLGVGHWYVCMAGKEKVKVPAWTGFTFYRGARCGAPQQKIPGAR